MVERYRRGKGKRKLLGNHQKCWIWGRNAVLETLRAGRWPIVELILDESLGGPLLAEARELADRSGVSFTTGDADALRQRCRSAEHQGFAAKMTEFPYANVDELLDSKRATERPLIIVCDGVQDPYNFGAIIRSCDVLGATGVLIESSNQVGVTSMVARSSAGAVNHVPVARVDDAAGIIAGWRANGVAIVAASEKASVMCSGVDLAQSTAIVIGNEGSGVHSRLLEHCDHIVAIPQTGHVGSLNAAVAAGVLLYEARRQRIPGMGR